MTAPLHSEQVKHGRKIVGEYVASPITNNGKRDNSLDYSTIQQHNNVAMNMVNGEGTRTRSGSAREGRRPEECMAASSKWETASRLTSTPSTRTS